MRLVNTSNIELEEFSDDSVPSYVILSHTWGDNEVGFRAFQEDAKGNTKRKGAGWAKITNACHRAKANKIPYIWIDTCCIDRSSSGELEQAVNSMFRYYRDAKACYALLEDVEDSKNKDQLRKSRWFRRGWTLQELLAPKDVIFFINGRESEPARRSRSKSAWEKIGRRGKRASRHEQNLDPDVLAPIISEITRIGVDFLTGRRPLGDASVAARMSWAAGRQTTRREDRAYSLLGIFDVNMPTAYGEGDRAFERLQREIMKVSSDETVLAWHYGLTFGKCVHDGLFAKSPDCYEACAHLVPVPSWIANRKHYTVTNRGLKIRASVMSGSHIVGSWMLGLNCTTQPELHRATADRRERHIRGLVLCLTWDPSTGLSETWRHSNSRPFEGDPDAFLTKQIEYPDLETTQNGYITTMHPFEEDGIREKPHVGLYVGLAQPATHTLPFVMLLESSVLGSLEREAGFQLLDVEPGFAAQFVGRLGEEEREKWMVDFADVKDIHTDVFLHYRCSSARYVTRMEISVTRGELLSAAGVGGPQRTADIHRAVLKTSSVKTATYLCDDGASSLQILADRGCTYRTSGSVWFQVWVLGYRQTMALALGYTDKEPEGGEIDARGCCVM